MKVQIGGIVTGLQIRTTKKGDRFALLRLEDQASGVKCVVWPEVFSKCSKLLQDDSAVLIGGKVEVGDEGIATIIAEEVERLDEVLQRRAKSVIVRLPSGSSPEKHLDLVWRVLEKHKGDCEVLLEMHLEGGILVRSRAHGALRVRGSVELEGALREQGCSVEWLKGDHLRLPSLTAVS